MDPSAALLKEIAKRKTAPSQDAKKWKSRVEIEEERSIAYYEKEQEQEETLRAKKRRRIGPVVPNVQTNEPREVVSERDEVAKIEAEKGTSYDLKSHKKDKLVNEIGETALEYHDNPPKGSASENKGTGSSQVSRPPPAKHEETSVNCKEDQVHEHIRKHIRLWKSEIEQMSEGDRKKTKGRTMVKTFEQTKTWLKPLEKLLRKRKLKKAILDALRDIFDAVEERDYMKASRLYLERLAIGNAPWPMGATMVGIHARAAREKIGEDKIAHVMNDEQTRKYIQGVKRLLTVAERNFPAP